MPLLELCGFTSTHDPVIVKENGLYYRFQTGPGIPVAVSDNLCSASFTTRLHPQTLTTIFFLRSNSEWKAMVKF